MSKGSRPTRDEIWRTTQRVNASRTQSGNVLTSFTLRSPHCSILNSKPLCNFRELSILETQGKWRSSSINTDQDLWMLSHTIPNYHTASGPWYDEALLPLPFSLATSIKCIILTFGNQGPKRRLPPSPSLRSFGRRQENPDSGDPKRTLRTRRRKDQDRRASFPNHIEPQARIQHRRFHLPPRNNPLRRRNL